MAWNYNESDYDPEASGGGILPIGKYRVRIKEVCPKVSKSGNDMWELTLEVSGHNNYLWYNLVFLQDNPKATNQWLGVLFNSFGIEAGNMNYQTWVGKVGGCKVKHDEWGAKVHYFLKPEEVATLPPWQEPQRADGSGAARAQATAPNVPPPPEDSGDFKPIDETEDLPF